MAKRIMLLAMFLSFSSIGLTVDRMVLVDNEESHMVLKTVAAAGVLITVGLVGDLAVRGKSSILYRAYEYIVNGDLTEEVKDAGQAMQNAIPKHDKTVGEAARDVATATAETARAAGRAVKDTARRAGDAVEAAGKNLKDKAS